LKSSGGAERSAFSKYTVLVTPAKQGKGKKTKAPDESQDKTPAERRAAITPAERRAAITPDQVRGRIWEQRLK